MPGRGPRPPWSARRGSRVRELGGVGGERGERAPRRSSARARGASVAPVASATRFHPSNGKSPVIDSGTVASPRSPCLPRLSRLPCGTPLTVRRPARAQSLLLPPSPLAPRPVARRRPPRRRLQVGTGGQPPTVLHKAGSSMFVPILQFSTAGSALRATASALGGGPGLDVVPLLNRALVSTQPVLRELVHALLRGGATGLEDVEHALLVRHESGDLAADGAGELHARLELLRSGSSVMRPWGRERERRYLG